MFCNEFGRGRGHASKSSRALHRAGGEAEFSKCAEARARYEESPIYMLHYFTT
jgi:hypothetical protein